MDTYAAAIGVRNDLMQLFDARGSGPVALDPRRPDDLTCYIPVNFIHQTLISHISWPFVYVESSDMVPGFCVSQS